MIFTKFPTKYRSSFNIIFSNFPRAEVEVCSKVAPQKYFTSFIELVSHKISIVKVGVNAILKHFINLKVFGDL